MENTGETSKPVLMDPAIPFRVVVLHDVPPESTEVKTLYEVFGWGRESRGEYLYYGEIDDRALRDDGTGDLTTAAYHGSVEVSFGEVDVDDAGYYLETYGDGKSLFSLDSVAGLSATQVCERLGDDQDADLIFAVDDDSFAIIFVETWRPTVTLRHSRLDGERVTEINVTGHGDEVSFEWMLRRFDELVDRYREIPMNRFTGAIEE